MSFLYPLFLAGMVAVGLPIVLHMIRHHTRQRVTFSSLMFLRTTLPRFKNRSRLENLPLLILRCLILILLAFAFARPFLSRPAPEVPARLGRRLVLLIDTSASMRRAGAWDQVMSEARSALEEVGQTDRVCVMRFDRDTRIVMGFEQWATLEPAQRVPAALEQLSQLSPGWALTHLGHALVAAAEAIEDDDANNGQLPFGRRQVVLIGDLHQGSHLNPLAAYEWPKETEVVLKTVHCQGTTNAALQLVTDTSGSDRSAVDERPRVRVTNSSDATAEEFQLRWAEGTSDSASPTAVDIYVAPGRSVVVQAPAHPATAPARRLVLTGDDHDFDNVLYVAPRLQQQVNILYIGRDDPNDSRDMLYYVRRAFGANAAVQSQVTARLGSQSLTTADIDAAHLVIAADTVEQGNLAALRRYLETGRTLLLVMRSAENVATLAGLTGLRNLTCEEADVDRYAMLGRVEFTHPLLTPFSEPRFGDFTRIHFWKYRRINIADCPGATVLASFDSNDPAWFEMPAGKGSLVVWTCGWHPADSDLALSSKFVPLLHSVLEYSGVLAAQRSQYFVGDPVPMPIRLTSGPAGVQVRKPDNSQVRLEAGQTTYTGTDVPGIYTLESAAGNRLFAVNLPAQECRTDPMPVDDLEKLGVALEPVVSVPLERVQLARQRSTRAEMEYGQKVWRWVLLAALVLLLAEIGLAGWLTRPNPVVEGEQT